MEVSDSIDQSYLNSKLSEVYEESKSSEIFLFMHSLV